MPLNTQIIRDGEEMKLRWGHFHIVAMTIASVLELEPEDDKFFTHPVEVREELAENGYPAEPTPITPRMTFEMVGYHVLSNTPLNDGEVTLTKHHKFVDIMDGEILELQPGDVLRAWRN